METLKKLLPLCFLLPLAVAGQEASDRLVITGQIFDMRTGAPLPAANVLIGALGTGSASDDSGYYHIDPPITRYRGIQVDLTVHYIGYSTLTHPVRVAPGTIAFDFYLSPTRLSLRETVKTAPRRSAPSGSPSQIFSGEELRKTGSSNWQDALSGRIPGFQLPRNSGNLAAAPVFSFRGRSSFRHSASQYAIIVVDGMPYSNYMNDDGTISGPTLYIGMSEIEYIEVVRGPSAVLRFGPEAANGAIIITTKLSPRQ